jgi:hypothetical protein
MDQGVRVGVGRGDELGELVGKRGAVPGSMFGIGAGICTSEIVGARARGADTTTGAGIGAGCGTARGTRPGRCDGFGKRRLYSASLIVESPIEPGQKSKPTPPRMRPNVGNALGSFVYGKSGSMIGGRRIGGFAWGSHSTLGRGIGGFGGGFGAGGGDFLNVRCGPRFTPRFFNGCRLPISRVGGLYPPPLGAGIGKLGIGGGVQVGGGRGSSTMSSH